MTKFFTTTAVNTTHCNDRSQRYDTLLEARTAASIRLHNDKQLSGVVIMEAIELITPKPVVVDYCVQPIV